MTTTEPHFIARGTADKWPATLIANTDGASRGNPGQSSFGVTVSDESGATVYEFAQTLGEQTNNYAEYMAVKWVLEKAVENRVKNLTIRSDSQLLIRQLLGQYKVKSDNIRSLYEDCLNLSRKIPKVYFEHVRREENKRADELANLVLDGRSI